MLGERSNPVQPEPPEHVHRVTPIPRADGRATDVTPIART